MLIVLTRENDRGCLECVSHKPNANGYIHVKINGRRTLVHRYMYALKNDGETPEVVRHSCDNPKCLNPEHLLGGTHIDNVADRVERNRSAIGEKNGRSKLTKEIVIEIRRDKISTNSQLASRFGVDPKAIMNVRKGFTWKHVENA